MTQSQRSGISTSIPRNDDINNRAPRPVQSSGSRGFKAQVANNRDLQRQAQQQRGWLV